KLTPEQFGEVKPFLETSVSYHAVVRDGKVAFAVDKENAPSPRLPAHAHRRIRTPFRNQVRRITTKHHYMQK
ncbi:MAG: hypothetical protein IKN29_03415, partial [Bacteroidales bacterium]|nr:hypothetical protein [Bacteroidales bacterium]